MSFFRGRARKNIGGLLALRVHIILDDIPRISHLFVTYLGKDGWMMEMQGDELSYGMDVVMMDWRGWGGGDTFLSEL